MGVSQASHLRSVALTLAAQTLLSCRSGQFCSDMWTGQRARRQLCRRDEDLRKIDYYYHHSRLHSTDDDGRQIMDYGPRSKSKTRSRKSLRSGTRSRTRSDSRKRSRTRTRSGSGTRSCIQDQDLYYDERAREHDMWVANMLERDKDILESLVRSRTISPVQCEFCGEIFGNRREISFHFELDHVEQEPRTWSIHPGAMNDILRAVGRAMHPKRKHAYDEAEREILAFYPHKRHSYKLTGLELAQLRRRKNETGRGDLWEDRMITTQD